MRHEPLEQWIWLPEERYPGNQRHCLSELFSIHMEEEGQYNMVAFSRAYGFDKPIRRVKIRTSGDTFFRLYVNGVHCVTGPATSGGDWFIDNKPKPHYYATELTLDGATPGFAAGELAFLSHVRTRPTRLFECSRGKGGFFLTAWVTFADGTKTVLRTDEGWQAQRLSAYVAPGVYDGAIPPDEPVAAERIGNRWHCTTAPMPSCTETEIVPDGNPVTVPAGETVEALLPLDMIYTGYPAVRVRCGGRVTVTLRCPELGTEGGMESRYTFVHDDRCLTTELTSCGRMVATVVNKSDCAAEVTLSFVASHYPVERCAVCRTEDEELNRVIEVCNHTLKYCRQTLHLDSGSHCEPMACTGDYYVEALMTAMTFGDMRLAAFDVLRTAQILQYNDGRMFHTTYSLIWVQMLWDVYMRTGDMDLLADCEDALIILLERFAGYVGDNGIIETPPDYMFIDWLFPDNISTHHPPKALGQTCMNLFYYGALRTAARVNVALGEEAMAAHYTACADELRRRITELLYDPARGLFFEGLNTPTREDLLGTFMPRNVEKRYFRQHANILAAYFGILPEADCQKLLHRVMTEPELGVVQPYFAHFLLEAVYRNGLRTTYTRPILEQWKAPVAECPYGLAEGFHKPEPSYSFDHSHAWGGTPSYALPLALSGLEILAPGFKKIRLRPDRLGFANAYTEIPTPLGTITIDQREGQEPVITLPEGIALG